MEATTTSTIEPVNMYGYLNNLFQNPTAFVILVVVVLVYVIFFASLGNSSTPTNESVSTGGSGISKILIGIIVFVIIVIILLNVLQYFFSIDITASVQKLFSSGERELEIVVNQNTTQGNTGTGYVNPISLPNINEIDNTKIVFDKPEIHSSQELSEITGEKQVFNIPGNNYGYQEANAICQAYGGRLANYNEVENSYNNGAEWCNYGWSADQMALFPTQKKTYNELQKIQGHEHDCGRPGVNGGYIANPNVKFGVNCYGYKPKITTEEEEMMKNTTPYPKTEKDIMLEKQVDHWKARLDQILVSPFNYDTWSKV
jgi:hypothetical protein